MHSRTEQPKGPRVFLDYDQAQLDAAYDQTVWAPNMELMHRRQAALTAAARTRLPSAQRFAYGAGRMEHLDVYRTARVGAPVFAFVHGGAWKTNSSERYAFAAEMFVAAGAHFVLIDFDGVDVGRAPAQCRRHIVARAGPQDQNFMHLRRKLEGHVVLHGV